MGVRQNQSSSAGGFAKENGATGRIDAVEIIRRPRRVARNPADSRLVILVGGRIVARSSEFGQVMMIHYIEQVHVSVLTEIRVQREAEQTMIAPIADLFTDIEHGRRLSNVILKNPDPPVPVPLVHGSDFVPGNADSSVPIAADFCFDEAGRQRRGWSRLREKREIRSEEGESAGDRKLQEV